MDEYTTDYLEAAAEEAERFREAAMILAERAGVSAEEAIYRIREALQVIRDVITSITDTPTNAVEKFITQVEEAVAQAEPKHRRRKRQRERAALIERRYMSRLDRAGTGGNGAMKQERVIAILDFYRDIDKTVTMNERVIRNLEDQYYSTLGAVNSDGMPHGKGGVSNPVERVVLNIPQSVSDTIANMRRENERLTVIKGEILSELNALNYREKAVIYGFYIDGLQWERLSQRVNYSPRQCRNIRNIALDRLAKRFEQNKQISRYVFPEK